MIHFVTSNRYRREEVATLLAGLDVHWTRLSLPRPSGSTLRERALERARSAFAELREPCFAEVTELRVGARVLTGADFKKAVEAEGAAFFATHAGPASAAVAVAYVDGESSDVFEGALEGTLLAAPRGDDGYGWDAWLVPEGCTRTLAEMSARKAYVNMRLRPYVELADRLRGRTFGGVFEAHVTVRTRDAAELARFEAYCDELGVKAIAIELSRGDTPFQPMTGSYHHGALGAVQAEVLALSRALAAAGFEVTRTKIEATGANRDIPETDAEARAFPANYFEHHVKVRLPAGASLAPLTALVERHGAHLSRNARKVLPDGASERFVTLRAYDAGRRSVEPRFLALRAELLDAGYALAEPVREYTVYDTNAAVDAGWLPR